jgi:predicted TIM-barrel fold metal-dependent hydrolase
MADTDRPRIIALEEHYLDHELAAHFTGPDAARAGPVAERLYDLADLRLKEMDEAGVDLQVLSHSAPSAQKLPPDIAVDLARRVNDRLHEAVQRHPDRFAAFAALPTPDPEAAARELERCVSSLGFKGAMLHGLTAEGEFLDDRRFWPVYARAEELGVPIYLHPSVPHPAVREAYYKDYAADYPVLIRAGWGYTVEAATQAIRMVLSGVFDAHPRLQFILGHLGETLPFLLGRIDSALSRPGQKEVRFRDTFCRHFHITTSGFFSDPALLCCVMEMGVDRIMFSVDWPFEKNGPAVDWVRRIPLSAEDRAKIMSGNAERLLRL